MPRFFTDEYICCSYCERRYKFKVPEHNRDKHLEKFIPKVETHENSCLSNPKNRSCFTCRFKTKSVVGDYIDYACLCGSSNADKMQVIDGRLVTVAVNCFDWES